MSIELYGTEALGRLGLRLVRRISNRLDLSQGFSLLLLIAVAMIGIVGFTLYDSLATEAWLKNPRHTAFQQMVGGLGMGAVSSPRWCLQAFDPRLESICYATAYPVPGSYAYCSYDGTVATDFEGYNKKDFFLLLSPPPKHSEDKDHG